MQKKYIIIIVIVLTIAIVGAYFYFRNKKKQQTTAPPNNNFDSGSTTTTVVTPPASTTVVLTSPVGKTAYAKSNGVLVLYNDGTTYKTAAKNEWVGLVYAEVIRGGGLFYRVSGDRYVAANQVYLS